MKPAVFLEIFDGPDGLRGLSHRHLARTPRRPPDQYGARSTLSLSTPVLRARQTNFFTQNKEERSISIRVDRIFPAIHFEFDQLRHGLWLSGNSDCQILIIAF